MSSACSAAGLGGRGGGAGRAPGCVVGAAGSREAKDGFGFGVGVGTEGKESAAAAGACAGSGALARACCRMRSTLASSSSPPSSEPGASPDVPPSSVSMSWDESKPNERCAHDEYRAMPHARARAHAHAHAHAVCISRESVHAQAVYTWHLHLLQQPCRLGHVVIVLWSIDASGRGTEDPRTRTRTHAACLPQHVSCVPADGVQLDLQLRARRRDALRTLGACSACGLSKHGRLAFCRGHRRGATQPHLVCARIWIIGLRLGLGLGLGFGLGLGLWLGCGLGFGFGSNPNPKPSPKPKPKPNPNPNPKPEP